MRRLASPLADLMRRYRASQPEGELTVSQETHLGVGHVVVNRRAGDHTILAITRRGDLTRSLTGAFESATPAGFRTYLSEDVAAADAELFTRVWSSHVPYLDSPLTLAADRAHLGSLRRTRKAFLTAVATMALIGLVLGGLLVGRDLARKMELARLKAEFIGNVSHELKTPLTTIRMYAETLHQGRVGPERHRDYVGRILSQAEHLTLLIENVLQLSRADEVVLEQRRTVGPLAGLVTEAVDQLRIRWEGRTVEVALEPGLELECDARLVTLALANLLDNAAKYSPPDRPIRIEGRLQGSVVILDVIDRGRGIPLDVQAHIFERFYRAPNAAAEKGMGLGLFLVRKIADLHHGHVEFSSREGEGSTFTLRLPGGRPAGPATAAA